MCSYAVTNPTGGTVVGRGIGQPDPNDRLLEEVLSFGNLASAWKQVRSNKGAPGIDGVTIEEFPGRTRDHWKEIIAALKEYLQLIDNKKEISEELFRYVENYGKSKRDSQILNDVKRSREISSILWAKYEESINCLIQHYSTGEESFYKKYEKLSPEIANLEVEYRTLSQGIIGKIKF